MLISNYKKIVVSSTDQIVRHCVARGRFPEKVWIINYEDRTFEIKELSSKFDSVDHMISCMNFVYNPDFVKEYHLFFKEF